MTLETTKSTNGAVAPTGAKANGNGQAHLSSADIIQLEHEYGAHK